MRLLFLIKATHIPKRTTVSENNLRGYIHGTYYIVFGDPLDLVILPNFSFAFTSKYILDKHKNLLASLKGILKFLTYRLSHWIPLLW